MNLTFSRPQVMGILNVTPDSFSDGGRYSDLSAAMACVKKMVADGVDIIDIGGESTRPGAEPVSESEEVERAVPLIAAIRAQFDVPISIDTSKAAVMTAAVAAGATMINDVRALREEGALAAATKTGVPVCLMHMQGEPRTMQQMPEYDDVVADVIDFLQQRVEVCIDAGIAAEKIIIDPGLGFGKTVAHNLQLLQQLQRIVACGHPVLVGASRKSMIGQVLGKPDKSMAQRLSGSLAAASLAVWQGASIVRAHDVAETVDAVRFCTAVMQGKA